MENQKENLESVELHFADNSTLIYDLNTLNMQAMGGLAHRVYHLVNTIVRKDNIKSFIAFKIVLQHLKNGDYDYGLRNVLSNYK